MLTMEGRSAPSMRHTKADFDRVEGGAAFGLNDTSELAEGLDRAGRPRTLDRKNGRSGWGFGLAHWAFFLSIFCFYFFASALSDSHFGQDFRREQAIGQDGEDVLAEAQRGSVRCEVVGACQNGPTITDMIAMVQPVLDQAAAVQAVAGRASNALQTTTEHSAAAHHYNIGGYIAAVHMVAPVPLRRASLGIQGRASLGGREDGTPHVGELVDATAASKVDRFQVKEDERFLEAVFPFVSDGIVANDTVAVDTHPHDMYEADRLVVREVEKGLEVVSPSLAAETTVPNMDFCHVRDEHLLDSEVKTDLPLNDINCQKEGERNTLNENPTGFNAASLPANSYQWWQHTIETAEQGCGRLVVPDLAEQREESEEMGGDFDKIRASVDDGASRLKKTERPQHASALLRDAMFIQAPLGEDGYINATSEGSGHGLLLKAGVGGPSCAACPTGYISTSSDDFTAHHCRASSTSPEVELDEYFDDIEGESVLSLDLSPQPPIQQPSGAPTAVQGAVGHVTAAVQAVVGRATTAAQGTARYVTAAVQGAVGRATTAVQGTAGYVAAMHYYFKFEDAAVENMAASDHHQVSHSLPHLPHSRGFEEDGNLDVEKPAVDVDACKADNFVGDEAEKVLEAFYPPVVDETFPVPVNTRLRNVCDKHFPDSQVMNDNNSRSKCLCDLEERRTDLRNNTGQTTSVKVMAAQVPCRASLGRPCQAHHGGLGEDSSSDVEETDVDVEVANDPIIVASVLTNPDSAPLGVEGAPSQEDALPSALPSMMRWLQGDNIEASSLHASRVVEKLVAATTKAFVTVQASLPSAASLQNPCTLVVNDPSAQPAPEPPAGEGNAALRVRDTEGLFQGNDENVEAAGGEVPDLMLLTNQGALTTIATSATQAQAPPPIVVVNIVENSTKVVLSPLSPSADVSDLVLPQIVVSVIHDTDLHSKQRCYLDGEVTRDSEVEEHNRLPQAIESLYVRGGLEAQGGAVSTAEGRARRDLVEARLGIRAGGGDGRETSCGPQSDPGLNFNPFNRWMSEANILCSLSPPAGRATYALLLSKVKLGMWELKDMLIVSRLPFSHIDGRVNGPAAGENIMRAITMVGDCGTGTAAPSELHIRMERKISTSRCWDSGASTLPILIPMRIHTRESSRANHCRDDDNYGNMKHNRGPRGDAHVEGAGHTHGIIAASAEDEAYQEGNEWGNTSIFGKEDEMTRVLSRSISSSGEAHIYGSSCAFDASARTSFKRVKDDKFETNGEGADKNSPMKWGNITSPTSILEKCCKRSETLLRWTEGLLSGVKDAVFNVDSRQAVNSCKDFWNLGVEEFSFILCLTLFAVFLFVIAATSAKMRRGCTGKNKGRYGRVEGKWGGQREGRSKIGWDMKIRTSHKGIAKIRGFNLAFFLFLLIARVSGVNVVDMNGLFNTVSNADFLGLTTLATPSWRMVTLLF